MKENYRERKRETNNAEKREREREKKKCRDISNRVQCETGHLESLHVASREVMRTEQCMKEKGL